MRKKHLRLEWAVCTKRGAPPAIVTSKHNGQNQRAKLKRDQAWEFGVGRMSV